MKAIIDLKWVNTQIEKLQNKGANSKTEEKLDFRELATLTKIRSRCEPIEEPKPLPTKCINEWENHIYCPLVGYCQKCKDK